MAGFFKKAVNSVKSGVTGYLKTGTIAGAVSGIVSSNLTKAKSTGSSSIGQKTSVTTKASASGQSSRGAQKAQGEQPKSELMELLKKYWYVVIIIVVAIVYIIFKSNKRRPPSRARQAQARRAGLARLAKRKK